MRYLDTGSRDPNQTLAYWLSLISQEEIVEVRIQTGFFSLEGLSPISGVLEALRDHNQITNILIGSNESSTLREDVEGLIDLMGVPRSNANLGVVNFRNAYFHPKTYHVIRADGSQTAYVGSANLTAQGLALHVESAISLDTREGDNPYCLNGIKAAIDAWFSEERDGLVVISSAAEIDKLVDEGILASSPPPRPSNQNNTSTESSGSARPTLTPLYTLPSVRSPRSRTQNHIRSANTTAAQPPQTVSVTSASAQSVPRNGFPQYLLFEPNAAAPTRGLTALTGAQLPGGAVGLIIRLNRDSARHFLGRSGTANISIPVAAVSTLRFGVYGVHSRPRAEFTMRLRYLSTGNIIDGGTASTNVMGYGFTANETGHGDIRLLVPASVRELGATIEAAGLPLPSIDDYAFLEWPTPSDPTFRLSFLDRTSSITQSAERLFDAATKAGQLVGNGACWLPAGVSPIW